LHPQFHGLARLRGRAARERKASDPSGLAKSSGIALVGQLPEIGTCLVVPGTWIDLSGTSMDVIGT